MNKRFLRVFFVLILAGVVLVLPSTAEVTSDWSKVNFSMSSTYIYSLDVEGNCNLTTYTYMTNIDENYDFVWLPTYDNSYNVGIVVESYSNEIPTVTYVIVGDKEVNHTFANYSNNTINESKSYNHTYKIGVYPPGKLTFPRNAIFEIITNSRINCTASHITEGDYYKISLPRYTFPKQTFHREDFIIKLNLPNDPYYWVETLHTKPNYKTRVPFGRGESLEWSYSGESGVTDYILCNYRIHSDPLRESLDEATTTSKNLGWISIVIAFFSLILTIIFEWVKIKEIPEKIRSKYLKGRRR